MANRNWASGGKIYSMHVKPVLLDCNFIVTPTNGAGITNLKGPAVSKVFMNTSTTPSGGNPNPPAGYIYVKLADNYNLAFGAVSMMAEAPLSGTPVTTVVANSVYVITVLGTTTTAQWVAKGLPVGVTPAVGVSFVASASGALGGTGSVQAIATAGSNITDIQIVGNPDVTLANSAQPSNGGGYLILACFKNGALAAPATGTTLNLAFYLSDSSILIQGE
jgi:hypothetical protein